MAWPNGRFGRSASMPRSRGTEKQLPMVTGVFSFTAVMATYLGLRSLLPVPIMAAGWWHFGMGRSVVRARGCIERRNYTRSRMCRTG